MRLSHSADVGVCVEVAIPVSCRNSRRGYRIRTESWITSHFCDQRYCKQKMNKTKYHELEENEESEHQTAIRNLHQARRKQRLWTAAAVIQFIFLIGIAFTSIHRTFWSSRNGDAKASIRGGFPPAESSLRFQKQLFDKYGVMTSPTAKDPGPALDQAWHSLLSSMMIRVSPSELRSQTSASSIPLADGSGDYIASLGVYHELHCVKLLKHWLHKDHYLKDWEDEKVEQYWKHLNHCLDWIKTAALCRSDTTLTTLSWNGTRLDTEYPVEYTCAKPDSLFQWADQRAVDISDLSILEGPSS